MNLETLTNSAVLGMVSLTLFWLGVIVLAVRLIETPRSVYVIKLAHSIIFFVLSALLIAFIYEVATNQITFISWVASSLFLAEGIVLLINGWRCPLTAIAEKLGDSHGQITDTFLPKWFADRVFKIYGVSFVVGMALFVIRISF